MNAPPPWLPPAPVARPRGEPCPPGREATELLWFDPESTPAIRASKTWRALVGELEPDDTGIEDRFAPGATEVARARRLVLGVLTRAAAADESGVAQAFESAIDEEGTFAPPLVLVTGELQFPFDELATLKATVSAVMSLVERDGRLNEVVETVNDLLKTPWLAGSCSVAESLTARVKEAHAQAANRVAPPGYLEAHTERMLLEQRHYQRRTVLGEACIRCLLVRGAGAAPVPTYVPESLKSRLPMFQSFKVRLIAEAHVQQDQYEAHPSALRVVALGRVVGAPPRGKIGPKT